MQAEIESHYAQSLERLHEKYTRPRRMSTAAAAASVILRRGNSIIHEDSMGAIKEDEPHDADASTPHPSGDIKLESLSHELWHVLLEQIKKKSAWRNANASLAAAEMKSRLDHMERQVVSSGKKGMELVIAVHVGNIACLCWEDTAMAHWWTYLWTWLVNSLVVACWWLGVAYRLT